MVLQPLSSTLFPYTTLFRSQYVERQVALFDSVEDAAFELVNDLDGKGTINALLLRAGFENKKNELKTRLQEFSLDRKSTRLNSSHMSISYAVFCLKKKRTSS